MAGCSELGNEGTIIKHGRCLGAGSQLVYHHIEKLKWDEDGDRVPETRELDGHETQERSKITVIWNKILGEQRQSLLCYPFTLSPLLCLKKQKGLKKK